LIEGAAVAIAGWSVVVLPGWIAWVGCGLGWALLTLAAIDWREFVLPDGITLPLTGAGLIFVALVAPADVQDHAIGALAGFGAFAAIAVLYRRWRKRAGLGFGDAKLMAAAGAWVSWTGLPSVVAIAAGAALGVVGARAVLRSRHGRAAMSGGDAIAFGPYLAFGLWWVWLYGPLNLVAAN
jgi:leader peptidase (prepilin peptidase)/N-methyltransferase